MYDKERHQILTAEKLFWRCLSDIDDITWNMVISTLRTATHILYEWRSGRSLEGSSNSNNNRARKKMRHELHWEYNAFCKYSLLPKASPWAGIQKRHIGHEYSVLCFQFWKWTNPQPILWFPSDFTDCVTQVKMVLCLNQGAHTKMLNRKVYLKWSF